MTRMGRDPHRRGSVARPSLPRDRARPEHGLLAHGRDPPLQSSERNSQRDFVNRLLLENHFDRAGLFILLEDQMGIVVPEKPQRTALRWSGMHLVAGCFVYLAR